jgi:hypothetical protein
MAIVIAPDKEPLLSGSFITPNNLENFKIKYKEKFLEITLTRFISSKRTVIEHNILESSSLNRFVVDHGSYLGFDLIVRTADGATTYPFQQMPGFCGGVFLTFMSDLKLPFVLEMLEDFFYLSGYTVLFLSLIREDKFLLEKGYNIYMNITNRRTHNNVNLYYKSLKNPDNDILKHTTSLLHDTAAVQP